MSMQVLDETAAVALSWMLTYLIHSTILVLTVWLLCRAIKPIAKRIGAGAENLAWKLALVGALVSASVQVAAGIDPALGAFELAAAPKSSPTVVEPAPAPTPAPAPSVTHYEINEDDIVMLRTAPEVVAPVAATPVLAGPGLAATTPAPMWPKLLVGAWLLGMMIGLVRLLGSVRGLRRKLGDRSEVIEDPVLENFLTLCRDLDIRRKIRLTASSSISSPIALWRGEIVLPQRAVEELSPAAMRSVLAHELAHLERRDPHWLAFAAALEALFFFQPLNRLARRGMQESAELLCDDWAIKHTGDGVQFAKSLAELASWSPAGSDSALVPTMVDERPLVRRVRRALDGDPRRFNEDEGHRPSRLLFGVGMLSALIMVAPGVVDASPPTNTDKAEKKAKDKDKDKDKQAKKSEREAERAAEKARAAREKAEQARIEAEQAEREAERARREAMGRNGGRSGSNGLSIRSGGEYLIIDENGVQLRSKDADLDITQDGRMRMRIHDGENDVDVDLDLEELEGLAEQFMGEFMGPGGMVPVPRPPMAPHAPMPPHAPMAPGAAPTMPTPPQGFGPTFGPGFDPEAFEAEMEAWASEMERWAEQFEGMDFDADVDVDVDVDEEAIEREIEQRLRELEQLRQRRRQGGSRAPVAPPAPPMPPAPPTPAVAPLIPA